MDSDRTSWDLNMDGVCACLGSRGCFCKPVNEHGEEVTDRVEVERLWSRIRASWDTMKHLRSLVEAEIEATALANGQGHVDHTELRAQFRAAHAQRMFDAGNRYKLIKRPSSIISDMIPPHTPEGGPC